MFLSDIFWQSHRVEYFYVDLIEKQFMVPKSRRRTQKFTQDNRLANAASSLHSNSRLLKRHIVLARTEFEKIGNFERYVLQYV